MHYLYKKIVGSLFLICVFFFSAAFTAHAATYYVDNSCTFNGGGTSTVCAVSAGTAGPFNSIANMQAKSGGYVPNDTINLKRGETFRETFTLPSSGSTTGYITLDAYGSGAKPILKESNLLPATTTWILNTNGTPNTYMASTSPQIYFLWKNGDFVPVGSGPATLNNNEWYWATSTLYFRDDSGSPASTSAMIEGAVRSNAILMTSKNYWNINNIQMLHTNGTGSGSYAVRISTAGDHINFNGLVIDEAAGISVETLGTNITIQNTSFGATRLLSQRALNIAGASSTVTVTNGIFHNTMVGNAIKIVSGAVNIYNSLFDSYATIPILDSSAQPVNISNVIINGSSNTTADFAIKNTGTGVLTISNSIILPDGRSGSKLLPAWSSTFVNGGGIKYTDPQWINTRNIGLLAFVHDDANGTNDWYNLTRLADEYGIKITDALNTGTVTSANILKIQNGINRGHSVVSHSRSHADMSTTTAFRIQYVGSGTSALMSISSTTNTLVVTVGGTPADSLNLDLTQAPYNEEVGLCGYLTTNYSGRYTCTQGGGNGTFLELTNKEGSLILAEVTNQDIKTAPYIESVNLTNFYNNELVLPQLDITADFVTSTSSPYHGQSFIYPGGQYSTTSIAQIIAAGYIGARSTDSLLGNPPNWQMSGSYNSPLGTNLYRSSTIGAFGGDVLGLDFENNANDVTATANNFTANNATYSTTSVGINASVSYTSQYSALLNGTSTYFTHVATTNFNFSAGDYTISAWVNPLVISGNQTLYFQGTDASNYHQLYIDSTGAVVYSIVSGGVETLHLASASSTITTGSWKRINLKVESGTYTLYLGTQALPQDPIVLVATTSAALPNSYTGNVYIGCGYDFVGLTVTNCYNGYLDYFVLGNMVYAGAMGMLSTLSSNGGATSIYSHMENVPLPIYRMIFDAIRDYTGRVNIMSYDDELAYIRSHGTAQPDGQTWVYKQSDGSDYHLRSSSPAIGAGAVVAGRTTDYDGNVISGTPDIGPFQYVASSTSKNINSFKFANLAVVGKVNSSSHTVALTVPYGTDVTTLTPTISIDGSSVSPVSGVAQNFTSPVTYTVTASDTSAQTYTVNVTTAPNTDTTITSFNLASPAATGIIDNNAHTVALTVPYGTDVTSLTPTITLATGATVSPTSGTARDFTSPQTYTVTAQDGVTTQTYTVTVTVAPGGTRNINASAGPNGFISSSGTTTVSYGGSQSYTITPSSGYHIYSVVVDGSPIAVTGQYTFSNVIADHTIYATFEADVVYSSTSGPGWGSTSATNNQSNQIPATVPANQPVTSGVSGTSPTSVSSVSSSIVINNSATTTLNKVITLNIKTTKDIKTMAISFTKDFTNAKIENYNPSEQIDLCPMVVKISNNIKCPKGVYTIYTKLYDASGIPSEILTDTIVLGSVATSSLYTFTRDLSVAMTGSDVKALQKFLNINGFIIAKVGAGSQGQETTFFGPATRSALISFQKSVGINPTGFLGPLTRAYINRLWSTVQ